MNPGIRAVFFLVLIQALVLHSLAQYKPPDPNKPKPIAALDTVFIEEMTWMEPEEPS